MLYYSSAMFWFRSPVRSWMLHTFYTFSVIVAGNGFMTVAALFGNLLTMYSDTVWSLSTLT